MNNCDSNLKFMIDFMKCFQNAKCTIAPPDLEMAERKTKMANQRSRPLKTNSTVERVFLFWYIINVNFKAFFLVVY